MKRFCGLWALASVYLLAWAVTDTLDRVPLTEWPAGIIVFCAVCTLAPVGIFSWANWPPKHPDDGYTGDTP